MSKGQNDALRELEALAAEWIERQRQRLIATRT